MGGGWGQKILTSVLPGLSSETRGAVSLAALFHQLYNLLNCAEGWDDKSFTLVQVLCRSLLSAAAAAGILRRHDLNVFFRLSVRTGWRFGCTQTRHPSVLR